MRFTFDSDSDSLSSDSEIEYGAADASYLATKQPPKPKSRANPKPKPAIKHSPSPQQSSKSPRVTFAPSTSSSHRNNNNNNNKLSESSSSSSPEVLETSYRPQTHKKALAYWASLDPPVWRSSSLVHMKSSLQHLALPARRNLSPLKASQARPSQSQSQAEVDSITALLESLEVSQAKETAAMHAAFEERNRSLWHTIESAISAKEAEARLNQQREAEHLAAAREKQAQAERQAQQAQAEALQKEQQRKEKQAQEEARQREAEQKNQVGQQMWRQRRELVLKLKEVGPAVSANAEWRKACREAKKVITPKVGQVTNSRSHIQTIASQISQACASVQSIEAPYLWTLNHLAKSLIHQAETELTARLSASFPLARLTHLLFAAHPTLGSVLIARLSKKCFYLNSYVPPRSEYPADRYAKALGVKDGEGFMESAARLRGIVALFSAIVALSPECSPNNNCPPDFRCGAAWTFLAGLTRPEVSLNGRQDAAPGLFDTAFEVSGWMLQGVYGKQFEKLWRCVLDKVRQWSEGGEGWVKASVKRLELRLEEWEMKGVQLPEGLHVEA